LEAILEFPSVHLVLVVKLMGLLVIANGTPVIAKKIMGNFLAYPLDGGLMLKDGRPLLGRSKTIRGIVLALIVTSFAAPIIGLDWTVGLLVAATAMAGDLVSSFVKRRMKREPSSMVLGLDQIPESLLPALASRYVLPLTLLDIGVVTVLFLVGELAASRVLFALAIRDRPY
jgi:CDP-2,3-bis-(O-geranylgeranyl)-sn-glycerol synthase